MPWYKIKFFSGPGHQSEDISYEFSDLPLTTDEKRDLFEERTWFHDNVTGSINIVTNLPAGVKRSETKKYRNQLHHAQRMLDVISKTPELKE